MPTHVFFDLDNTLTLSRDRMAAVHVPTFDRLCKIKDVIVVTGGAEEQIRKQIPFEAKGAFYMLSQQGNYAVHKNGDVLWRNKVTPEQERAVRAFAKRLTDEFTKENNITLSDPDDIFENRGSQFASSVLGFHESNERKYSADPDQSKRRALLARHPSELQRLREAGIEAMPAGTTTFDFILLGKNKGFNITQLVEREGWKKGDCLYIGDALFPGGNDETVIGVIPTRAVKNPDDTFRFIEENLVS